MGGGVQLLESIRWNWKAKGKEREHDEMKSLVAAGKDEEMEQAWATI